MSIQWYPGHMHKAQKEIRALLPKIDILIEVLDARLPYSSQNPMLTELRGEKPCIKVLNKSDLCDLERLHLWQNYLEQERGISTLAISKQQPESMRSLLKLCHELMPQKAAKGQAIFCLIMGIPNVGKSTLINVLAGKTIAKTGNEPSITKILQQIPLAQGIVLYDTPGLLWPKVENPYSGLRLAASGAIKDSALSHDQVALFSMAFLLRHYPGLLLERFRWSDLPTSELGALEAFGKQRGCLVKGGKVDVDKAAKLLLTELRSGTLGRMCLELPEMIAQELVELEAVKAQKLAEKLTRKQKYSAEQN